MVETLVSRSRRFGAMLAAACGLALAIPGVFDYDPASDSFTPNKTGVVNCGFACHSLVAKKDYIFTTYGTR